MNLHVYFLSPPGQNFCFCEIGAIRVRNFRLTNAATEIAPEQTSLFPGRVLKIDPTILVSVTRPAQGAEKRV
jgi:hypothetical protein